jgi:ABC-2 type transport system ATP-binding protein
MEHGRLVALGTPAQLARETIQSYRLEIETDPDALTKALTILGQLETVSDVSRENSHVLLITGATREDVPILLSNLLRADVPIYRVSPQEPSLEDVYFSLQGEKEKV